MCDADCHFIYLSIHCPGGTGDSNAFFSSSLYDIVNTLPPGLYLIADNAYTLSGHLLIPYSGINKKEPTKDTYNFFLSQLRIQIEQAFGMLEKSGQYSKDCWSSLLLMTFNLLRHAFRAITSALIRVIAKHK